MQNILDRLGDISEEYGMSINIKTTEVTAVSKQFGGNLDIVLNEELRL